MAVVPRQTKQKRALRDAFVEADRPLSTEEALTLAKREVPAMNIATAYRNISALTDEGWLIKVELPGTSPRYEVAGKKHHHHFQCNQCSRVYELDGCVMNTKPVLPKGFRLTGHEFFLYGICANCR
jgi:Fur family ferric uptake transcriptional regulator